MSAPDDPPIPRYCPLEHPPDLCYRGCGMGACELVKPAPVPELIEYPRAVGEHPLCKADPEHLLHIHEHITPTVSYEMTPRCYACNEPLDFEPTSQPALCGDCDNIP